MARKFCRLLLISLVLPLATSGAPENHSGKFVVGCAIAWFHIAEVRELSGDELVITVGHGFPGPGLGTYLDAGPNTWLDVSGERCPSQDKCQPLKGVQIWFEPAHGKLKRVSGKYSFDLDSQRIEGTFLARNRSPHTALVCE
jgi:hypothetical protein